MNWQRQNFPVQNTRSVIFQTGRTPVLRFHESRFVSIEKQSDVYMTAGKHVLFRNRIPHRECFCLVEILWWITSRGLDLAVTRVMEKETELMCETIVQDETWNVKSLESFNLKNDGYFYFHRSVTKVGQSLRPHKDTEVGWPQLPGSPSGMCITHTYTHYLHCLPQFCP